MRWLALRLDLALNPSSILSITEAGVEVCRGERNALSEVEPQAHACDSYARWDDRTGAFYTSLPAVVEPGRREDTVRVLE